MKLRRRIRKLLLLRKKKSETPDEVSLPEPSAPPRSEVMKEDGFESAESTPKPKRRGRPRKKPKGEDSELEKIVKEEGLLKNEDPEPKAEVKAETSETVKKELPAKSEVVVKKEETKPKLTVDTRKQADDTSPGGIQHQAQELLKNAQKLSLHIPKLGLLLKAAGLEGSVGGAAIEKETNKGDAAEDEEEEEDADEDEDEEDSEDDTSASSTTSTTTVKGEEPAKEPVKEKPKASPQQEKPSGPPPQELFEKEFWNQCLSVFDTTFGTFLGVFTTLATTAVLAFTGQVVPAVLVGVLTGVSFGRWWCGRCSSNNSAYDQSSYCSWGHSNYDRE